MRVTIYLVGEQEPHHYTTGDSPALGEGQARVFRQEQHGFRVIFPERAGSVFYPWGSIRLIRTYGGES